VSDDPRQRKSGDGPRPPAPTLPSVAPAVTARLRTPLVETRFKHRTKALGKSPVAEPLTITKGSTKPFEVRLLDEHGQPENLAGADRAAVTVRAAATDAVAVLERTTVAGTLTIDVPRGTLVGALDQATADALVPGFYIGEAAVRIGGTWFHSEAFHVRIVAGLASHP